MTAAYEIILPGRARAEAGTLSAALTAAATLVDDAATHFGAARQHRRELHITRNGTYDGRATELARSGRRSA